MNLKIDAWPGSVSGKPLPQIKVAYPPKLYSSEYNSPDFYKTKDGELFLAFWPNGEVTLCVHDASSDLCNTVDGNTYHGAKGQLASPRWIMPVQQVDEPAA